MPRQEIDLFLVTERDIHRLLELIQKRVQNIAQVVRNPALLQVEDHQDIEGEGDHPEIDQFLILDAVQRNLLKSNQNQLQYTHKF